VESVYSDANYTIPVLLCRRIKLTSLWISISNVLPLIWKYQRYWLSEILISLSIAPIRSRCLCWQGCQRALVDGSGVIPSRHHRHHHHGSHAYIHPGDEQSTSDGRGSETSVSPHIISQSIVSHWVRNWISHQFMSDTLILLDATCNI
jgi:hypothetical protein